MKLLCLVALAVCAVAQGASLQNEIPAPGVSVDKDLASSQYELHLVALNHDEIKEVVLTDAQAQNVDQRLITDAIAGVLEDFRDVVINGNENVPVLDPLTVDDLGPYNYVATGIRGELYVRNLRTEGLRWFIADRLTVNALRLTFGMTLTIPWVTVTGSYDANARVTLINHQAGGNFRIFVNRIDVDVDMRMGTNIFGGGHLVLRELDIRIDIHDTQISITGMTGSTLINAYISSTIQNISQDLVQNQLENISTTLSEELFDVINEVLRDYSVSDIFG